MFSSIDNSNEAYVELTLADGVTKIKLPKYAAFSIAFESDEVFYASPSDNELKLVLPVTLKESDYRSTWRPLPQRTVQMCRHEAPGISGILL